MNNDQSNFQPQQYDPYEDEIELMDYLKVLWKWKYLILLGTLVCIVVAAIVSFNMTKVYSVKTVLTPGMAKMDGNGQISYIASLQEIKTSIETGAFESTILKNIAVPNEEDLPQSLAFKVTTPKGSNALEVAYETPRVDLGLQILANLNKALLDKFDGIVRYYNEEYDIQISSKANDSAKIAEKIDKANNDILTVEAENQGKISEIQAQISSKRSGMGRNEAGKEGSLSIIENKISDKKSEIERNSAEKVAGTEQSKNEIASLKARIVGKKKQIKNLGNRIADVKAEIIRISKNTDLLLKDRDKFLTSAKNENNILASIMYTTTIQQNIGYLNSLRSTVNNSHHQIFQENVGIEKLENDIKNIKVQISNLEKQTKINNGKLLSDVEDLHAQKTNLVKQTTYKNETLKSDMGDYKSQIKSLEAQKDSREKSLNGKIIALESQKTYIIKEIKNLEFKKNYVQNIQILQPPKSSLSPIKPKKKLNVLLAGVVGLFLTVFLAFFIEYISRHKNDEANR